MFKEGLKILLVLAYLFTSHTAFAADDAEVVNYTVAPLQSILSGKVENKYSTKNMVGGFHFLAQKIFDELNLKYNYIPYDNYNNAIQNTMLFNSTKNPQIIFGAFFDEDKFKYLEYIPYSIYKDYVVIVLNKQFVDQDFKSIKGDLQSAISNLSSKNKLFVITGQKFNDISISESSNNISDAMERVFVKGDILLSTWTTISDYLEKNKGASKLNMLTILKYPKSSVNYFIAVNKKSNFLSQKYDEQTLMFDKFNEVLQSVISSEEFSKNLTN